MANGWWRGRSGSEIAEGLLRFHPTNYSSRSWPRSRLSGWMMQHLRILDDSSPSLHLPGDCPHEGAVMLHNIVCFFRRPALFTITELALGNYFHAQIVGRLRHGGSANVQSDNQLAHITFVELNGV